MLTVTEIKTPETKSEFFFVNLVRINREMELKNMSLILGFLGFVFLQGLLVCTAYNVHHYNFIVSFPYILDPCKIYWTQTL